MLVRVIVSLVLILAANIGIAKTISPANYDIVPPKFRGDDQAKAKKELRANMVKAAKSATTKSQAIVSAFKVSAPDVDAKNGIAAQQALKGTLLAADVQIVDRDVSAEVKKEISFIEETGASRGITFETADYFFKGEVLSVSNTSEYSERRSYTDKEGKTHITPSKCVYSSSAKVSIIVYTMNPFEIDQTILTEGSASNEQENLSRCGVIRYADLNEAAIKAAAGGKSDQIKDVFAPKGWVVDRRVDPKKGNVEKGKKMIFKSSFPKSIGTKPGTKIQVYKMVENYDLMSDTTKREKALIGMGEIVNTPSDDSVWFKMDDKKDAAQLLLGDLVEVDNDGVCTGSFIEIQKCRVMRNI